MDVEWCVLLDMVCNTTTDAHHRGVIHSHGVFYWEPTFLATLVTSGILFVAT